MRGAARAHAVDDGTKLQLVGTLGVPKGVCEREHAVDRHCGHCGSAADEASPVWASDLKACAERSPGGFFGRACTRLLAVPLQHRGRTLGVYNLFFDSTAREPEPATLAMLKSIGELLGLALNNARLEQEHIDARLRQQRQWMAAEVHDSIAQSLAFVKMRLPLLHDAMLAHDDERALGYCGEVRGAVTQAHANLRGLLTHLRAPMDPQGPGARAGRLCAGLPPRQRRGPGVQQRTAGHQPDRRAADAGLPHRPGGAEQRRAPFAAVQARLRIARTADGRVEVVVEDDGVGLQGKAASAGSHYGLEIMTARARLGGTLRGRAARVRRHAGAADLPAGDGPMAAVEELG